MATAFFPVITHASKKGFDPYETDQFPHLDITDLAECNDQLGKFCAVHHCVRYLDEAPIVSATTRDGDAVIAKRELFPHSWIAIVTHTVTAESRQNRRKTVTVRYCPACREAADRWFREHLAA